MTGNTKGIFNMEDVVIEICGYRIIISACDADKVAAYRWHISRNNRARGVYFSTYIRKTSHERKKIMLHRFILNAPSGMMVDHANCNTLDNRRENLRICTPRQSAKNISKHKDGKTPYKGVYYNRTLRVKNKWRAQIKSDGQRINLGSFMTQEEAYIAYCNASKKYHGEFGRVV